MDTENDKSRVKSKDARILIVDDDEDFSGSLADILDEACAPVECVRDGEEAVRKIQAGPYAAVLMDIKMPKASGVETLARIRALRPGTRVWIMTGYAQEDVINEALRQGVEEILYKPIDIPGLISAINERIREP